MRRRLEKNRFQGFFVIDEPKVTLGWSCEACLFPSNFGIIHSCTKLYMPQGLSKKVFELQEKNQESDQAPSRTFN